MILLLGVCLLYVLFVLLFALVDSEWCLLFSFYDVRKRRRRKCREALFQVPVTSKSVTPGVTRQAIPMLADTNTYHYLSCMFLLLKFYKNWLNKTIFVVAITTILLYKLLLCQ